MFQKFLTTLLDVFFPITCLGCKKQGSWLCLACLQSIPLCKNQVCPLCKQNNTPRGEVCFSCQGKSSLDGVWCVSYYQHALLATTIHTYKYRFIQKLALPLGQLLTESIRHTSLPLPSYLCPVPLHSFRLRWRGFNQSELLAQHLSQNLLDAFPLPLFTHLKRVRFTTPQASLNDHTAREKNLRDAFALAKNAPSLQGTTLWLIDDVATTLATLEECATVLKKAGAKKVHAIVLAR